MPAPLLKNDIGDIVEDTPPSSIFSIYCHLWYVFHAGSFVMCRMCYSICCMDVRKKFTLHMTVLIIVVVILSVFVFFSATTDPFEQEDFPVEDVTPGALFREEDAQQEVSESAADEEPVLPEEADDIVATVTLSDNQIPEKELRQRDAVAASTDDTAVYTVSLRASWSEQLHPRWYPQGAHLSPMIAWSHRLKDVLFKEHGIASEGMEIMAETGAPRTLVQEIENGILAGTTLTYNTGSVFNAPGENVMQMTMEKGAPYITAVSMIAPSPDWFIAARNVALYANGAWIDRAQIPAVLYDAGTDSGVDFTAADADTDPPQPIMRIRNVPPIPIATFEFIRN